MPTTLIWVPDGFKKLTPEQRAEYRCGPGKLGGKVVPDSLWGLSILVCCQAHDYGYAVGEALEDKLESDRGFLNNMLRKIDTEHRGDNRWHLHRHLLRKLRTKAAFAYYEAVRDFGGPAFWRGKNASKNEIMG